VWNAERLFNMKAGFDGSHDMLPKRFTEEPLSDGDEEGQISRVNEMLPEYYSLRRWSGQGEPLSETLKALGLEDS
jgi:aldehyde:ferredoxin oxidoreductase